MNLGLRETVTLLLVVGVLAGAYFLGFKPLGEHRKAIRADIDQRNITLHQLRATNASLADLEQQLSDMSTALAHFEQRLPREKDVQQMLGNFAELAEAHQLTVQTVRPGRSEVVPGGIEQPIEVNLRGPYTAFHAFLTQVEQLDRISRVKHLSLKKLDERDGNGAEAKLTLSIFFAPDSSKVATSN